MFVGPVAAWLTHMFGSAWSCDVKQDLKDRGTYSRFVADEYEFDPDEVVAAFERAGGECECCRKALAWANSRRTGGWGAWEAHHGSRASPVVLCTGEPENCHLNCGHGGNYQNPGITPRVHRGG